MRLLEFSVTNYRSITKAHKIKLQDLTILVGKNNAGKSNVLNALNVAMRMLEAHSRGKEGISYPHYDEETTYSHYSNLVYNWKRDFPLQLQNRGRNLESIFRLDFMLEENEKKEFHDTTGIRGNEVIPISIKIGKNRLPKIEVPKRGSSSYNKKSKLITEFISQRIFFNYIQAVRTEDTAMAPLRNIIREKLSVLETNEEYYDALAKVKSMQDDMLDKISAEIVEPLKAFLPNICEVKIKIDRNPFHYRQWNGFDVLINDGTETSIINKGDGIKSLVAIAMLKERKHKNVGASIIAIEEPESHLHSGAIHDLVEVINKLSLNSQVIITTHNPLFVQQSKISANIIVNDGTARQAKSISEIRNVLGVWPSDNLKNARFVLVVEGECDRMSVAHVLSLKSEEIKKALQSNRLVIKALGGASNLPHDLADLKHSMCKYVVLLDDDSSGQDAYKKATSKKLIEENMIRFTKCPSQSEAEFEDCILPKLYIDVLKEKYLVDFDKKVFKGKKKWSERIKDVFNANGAPWNERIETNVKFEVANQIVACNKLEDILIPQKSGFIDGLVISIELMLREEK